MKLATNPNFVAHSVSPWNPRVFHTPFFYPGGLRHTYPKSSEYKINRAQSERSLPEIPKRGQRGSKPKGLCGYLHLHLGAVPEISLSAVWIPSCCQNCQLTKLKQSSNKFDVLCSSENKSRIGEYSASQDRAFFLRHYGQEWGLWRALEEATGKWCMIV